MSNAVTVDVTVQRISLPMETKEKIFQIGLYTAQCYNALLSFWQRTSRKKRTICFLALNAVISFLRFKARE
jgi:hypothetical protein